MRGVVMELSAKGAVFDLRIISLLLSFMYPTIPNGEGLMHYVLDVMRSREPFAT